MTSLKSSTPLLAAFAAQDRGGAGHGDRTAAAPALDRGPNRAAAWAQLATVSRVLRRLGLNRILDLEPVPAVVRYEHAAPGDLLHLDIKRLVRIRRPSHRVTGDRRDGVEGIGAEFLHIAIDDHSRLAFTNHLLTSTARPFRDCVGRSSYG